MFSRAEREPKNTATAEKARAWGVGFFHVQRLPVRAGLVGPVATVIPGGKYTIGSPHLTYPWEADRSPSSGYVQSMAVRWRDPSWYAVVIGLSSHYIEINNKSKQNHTEARAAALPPPPSPSGGSPVGQQHEASDGSFIFFLSFSVGPWSLSHIVM